MAENGRFMEALKLEIGDFHREKLIQIDEFDYEKVLKKVGRDLGGMTDRYLLEGEFSLKQYYAVALLDPLNEHAVSKLVDPFWHAHVLFTQDYMDFCNSIFGGYVHHTPLDPDDTREVRRVEKLYEYTLGTYKKIFSDIDQSWWPEVGSGMIGLASRVVCLHQNVKDPEIMAHALFEKAGSGDPRS